MVHVCVCVFMYRERGSIALIVMESGQDLILFDHGIIVGNIQDGEHYFSGSNSFSFFLDNNNKGILGIYEF